MKASGHKPHHGEVWWVNFEPSTGHEYKEVRPAVVIQAVELDTSRVISVVPLTTKVGKGEVCDVVIPKDKHNRLMKDSLAKIQFVQSFDRARFDFCIGVVNDESLRQIKESLRVHFGL